MGPGPDGPMGPPPGADPLFGPDAPPPDGGTLQMICLRGDPMGEPGPMDGTGPGGPMGPPPDGWKVWMKCILTWTMLQHTGQPTVMCLHHLKVICQWMVIWLPPPPDDNPGDDVV